MKPSQSTWSNWSTWSTALQSTIGTDGSVPPFWLAFTLSLLALACKAPDGLITPQFWAEDGVILFAQQHYHVLPKVFTPYAGYLLAIPRLVAYLADVAPARYIPALYAYSAWIVGALALCSLRNLRLGPLPYVLALGGLALTPTNGEIFGTIINVQWLLQFYVLARLCVFARGEQSRMPWGRVALALLVGTTGPFAIFGSMAAIGLWILERIGFRRRPRAHTAPVWNLEFSAFLLATTVQAYFIATTSPPSTPPTLSVFLKVAQEVVSLVQLHAFTREPLSPELFWVFLLLSASLALVSLKARDARLALFGIYIFTGMQLAAVIHKCASVPRWSPASFDQGDRYFVAIKALIFWQLSLIALWLFARLPRLRVGVVAVAVVASLAIYRNTLQRPIYPDLKWEEHAPYIDAGEARVVPILPLPWYFQVKARPHPRAPH